MACLRSVSLIYTFCMKAIHMKYQKILYAPAVIIQLFLFQHTSGQAPEEISYDLNNMYAFSRASEKTAFGWNLHAAAELYMTKNISIRYSIGRNAFAPLEVEEIKDLDHITNEWFSIPSHSLNLSTWDRGFGLRVHLF